MTLAPAAARSRAIPRPIPRPAPVTSATRPSRRRRWPDAGVPGTSREPTACNGREWPFAHSSTEGPVPPHVVEHPEQGVKCVHNLRIPMDDGIRLAADLYAPL